MLRKVFGWALATFSVLIVLQTAAKSQFHSFATAPSVFDSVSIHKSAPATLTSLSFISGEVNYKAITLAELIQNAYGIRAYQLSNVPPNMASTRYDLVARVDNPENEALSSTPTSEELRAWTELRQRRLQVILKERFKFRMHTEDKVLTVLALVRVPTKPPIPQSKESAGGIQIRSYSDFRVIEATAVSMTAVANILSDQVNRKVIDESGLTGKYDFHLKWTPDESQSMTSGEPSLYTALREQLGLKLIREKSAVQLYVVDHAEEPTAN